MATTGLEYIVCAPYIETGGVVTYGQGKVVTKAIKADVGINLNDAVLYGDNRAAEVVKEFKDGKLTINGTHLDYDVMAMLFGHEVTGEPGAEELIARGDDTGDYVGTGFFANVIRDNVKSFRSLWFPKVKFGVPNESLETKADSIKFGTPTIEGTVMTDVEGVYKVEALHATRAAAIAWLNEKANIEEEEPEEP